MTGLLAAVLLAVPPQTDPSRYLPPPSAPVKCSADMLRYEPIVLPFDEPQTLRYRDPMTHAMNELEILPGYLVSECGFVKITNERIEAQRMRVELETLTTLREREFTLWRLTERQYRNQMERLQNPGWFERHRMTIGIVIGVVATSVMLATTASLIR